MMNGKVQASGARFQRRWRSRGWLWCFMAMAVVVRATMAQQNTPHAGYVYPAGGRQQQPRGSNAYRGIL